MTRRLLLAVSLALPLTWFTPPSFAQARTVFTGLPAQKISESGLDRRVDPVPRDATVNLRCVVSEIGGKFYWASRDNKELIRLRSGAFTTFVAVDGSGYIRIIDPAQRPLLTMSATEAKFDYVEHLLFGLRSVTYHGSGQ